ncbi:hypothetical protein SUGI_0705440 [Cryptomeria japonica]|nr:hypothetical protein SUGI_0705440 [Cryptomeria japonica]
MGFIDEFVEAMEPKFQSAFKALEELEAGLIANLDKGHMVRHYWLSMSSIHPNPNLWQQIDRMLDVICKFANNVVNVKDGLSAQSITPFLLPASQCEFTLNLVLEELQKDLWAVQINARATCCTGTALSMVMGLVGACVLGIAARIMLFIGGHSTQGSGTDKSLFKKGRFLAFLCKGRIGIQRESDIASEVTLDEEVRRLIFTSEGACFSALKGA